MIIALLRRRLRRVSVFVLVLLGIEFLDELVFGVREAAWPLIRDDLALTYAQVGLLLSLPNLVASFIEPVLGVLADVWKRRALVLGGGVLFALALLLTAFSEGVVLLMLAFVLLYPASGAFVSLSQATLMDSDPDRHEHNMARWVVAGSVGVVAGSLLIPPAIRLGIGWRGLFLGMAGLTIVLVALAWRLPFGGNAAEGRSLSAGFKGGLVDGWHALKRREVLRWLALLEFSDLMLDVLFGYLALYFVDVAGVDTGQAALAVAVWAGVGLVGDFLLIPLLERVRGLTYLRISAALELLLYPAFLLIPGLLPKLLLLGLLGLFNAGWYSILQGQLYSAMPGQSGTVMAVGSLFGLVGSLLPLGIGLTAERFGLNAAMWLLLAGPVALLVGIPRRRES